MKFEKKSWTILSAIVIVLTTTSWAGLRKSDFPKPTGAYPVGTFQVEFLDTSRKSDDAREGRKLLVQFYYPSQTHLDKATPYTPNPERLVQDLKDLYGVPKPLIRKVAGAEVPVQLNAAPVETKRTFPLLLFSHGYNGSRFQNSFLLPELASQGYVIASVEHTNAASGTVFRDGGTSHTTPFDSLKVNKPFSLREIHTWSLDQQFVLDQIAALALTGTLPAGKLVDFDRVGVFGHSFGGATSAATLTRDKRFRAGINLDGFYFGEDYKVGFEQPFLEIRADNKSPEEMSGKDLKEWKFTREEYRNFLFDEWERRIKGYARRGYESYSIRHANHMSFSDFSLMMPFAFLTAPHRREHHQVTTHLVLDFFNRTLKNAAPSPLPESLRPYIKPNAAE